MLLPFREIQRQVQAKIQNTNTSTSNENDLLPKIKDWINTRYARIYRSFPWREAIDNYDLELTASTTEYAFDRDVDKPFAILDKTNGIIIKEDTIENHIREFATTLDTTDNVYVDTPTRYRLTGVYSVKDKVSSAEKISVVSSSELDISPNVVRIEGLVGGVDLGEDIVITGTSAATSTNTYDANQKLRVSVGTSDGTRKTIVGKITVSGNTSSTVFSQIAPSEYAHAYQWFKVSPTPTSGATQPTWEIWYQRNFRRLDNDTDIPIFDCCIELIQGAFADALKEDGLENEGNIAEQKFNIMVQELQMTRKINTKIEQFKPSENRGKQFTVIPYQWIT